MTEADLIKKLEAVKTNADLIEVLEINPPESWIKEHPIIKTKFLPIDKVEFLLRTIFKFNYKIEVLEHKEIFNATSVAVRVHYRELDIPNNWLFHDGLGADEPRKMFISEAKTDMFENFAVSSSVPLAKTLAVKDACDHFGKLFGSDLNRVNTIEKKTPAPAVNKLAMIEELYKKLKPKILPDDRMHIERIIEDKLAIDYDKILTELKTLETKNKK